MVGCWTNSPALQLATYPVSSSPQPNTTSLKAGTSSDKCRFDVLTRWLFVELDVLDFLPPLKQGDLIRSVRLFHGPEPIFAAGYGFAVAMNVMPCSTGLPNDGEQVRSDVVEVVFGGGVVPALPGALCL